MIGTPNSGEQQSADFRVTGPTPAADWFFVIQIDVASDQR
jgi:hypothetical protein